MGPRMLVLFGLCACGRLSFDLAGDANDGTVIGDGGAGDATGDGSIMDGSVDTAGPLVDGALSCWQALVSNTGQPYGGTPVWNGTRYGVEWVELYDVRFATIASGDTMPSTPITVATVSTNSQSVDFAGDGTGWVVAWSEDRGATNTDLFINHITSAGVLATPTRITNASSASERPHFFDSGTEPALAWRDGRDASGYQEFFERFDGAWTTTLDDTLLTPSTASHYEATVASNGTELGSLYMDGLSFPTRTYFQRFDASGAPLAARVELTLTATSYRAGTVLWNGTTWAVAWGENRDGLGLAYYFARLDGNGAVIGAVRKLGTYFGSYAEGLAWNGSEYLATWSDTSGVAQRIASDGTPIGTPIPISGHPSTATWNGTAWALTWSTDTPMEVYIGELCP